MADATGEVETTRRPSVASKLRRLERPGITIALAVVALAALGAAFWLGSRFAIDPTPTGQSAAPVATAAVEQRVVDTRATFSATVEAGATQDIVVTSLAQPAVVTRQDLAPGDRPRHGALLGVVSGQAYIGLPGPLPLYRDLREGDQGEDVTYLQQSLRRLVATVRVTGTVDRATLTATAALFSRVKAPLSDETVIPFRQLVVLPADRQTVVASAGVGTELTGGQGLLTVQVSNDAVKFRADPVQAPQLSEGAEVTIQWSGEPIIGHVASIGPFTGSKEGKTPGRDVTVTIDTLPEGLTAGTAVTALGPGDSAEALAVPITGLRHDSDGDFVTLAAEARSASGVKSGAEQQPQRVPVKIVRSGGGWAAIEAELAPGDLVVVS